MLTAGGKCSHCGKRFWCGSASCPILSLVREVQQGLDRRVEAPSPPNFLVSWKGYPRVAVGPVLSMSQKPSELYELPLEEFIARRASELRTYQVKGLRTREEAALSVSPLHMSAELAGRPRGLLGGLSAPARQITLEDTPKVPGRVFSIVDSHDMKAEEAVLRLSRYGFDYAVRALSTGNLGIPTQRRLVPTRWAITAVDSILARDAFRRIRDAPQIREPLLFRSEHWDNRFWVVLLPWGWGFEMLERWPGGGIIRDWEYGRLKKDYASSITGAYYAARLEVLEWLARRGKQAACLVLRDIGEGYVYPAGVWHIREAVKKALEGRPARDVEELLKRELDWENWKARSRLWKAVMGQRRLAEFM